MTTTLTRIIQDPVSGLLYLVSLLLAVCIAISFHEWAHAFTANKLGDPTARNMGRMSLDPFRHMDPIGLICFALVGIGWAKPVIVNSRNLKHFRRDDILISLAGPVMNLLLSFVFYGMHFFTLRAMLFSGEISVGMNVLLQTLATIYSLNISLAIFNIIPIPPLDGFHVLSSLCIRKNYKFVEFFNRYGFILLLVFIFSGLFGAIANPIASALTSVWNSFYSLFV